MSLDHWCKSDSHRFRRIFKGLFSPKMKFLSFTHLNVVSMLYDFPQSVTTHSVEREMQWKVSESVCLVYVFQRGPWLEGSRRSSLSRRTQRKQLRRRKVKERIRRPQPKQRWSTHVLSARWDIYVTSVMAEGSLAWVGSLRYRCTSNFSCPLCRHRCQTPRPLNSILKANTQNLLCLLSWWMFKPKGHKKPTWT